MITLPYWRVFTTQYGKKWFVVEVNKNNSPTCIMLKGSPSLKDSVLKTDLETAKEIARAGKTLGRLWGIVSDTGVQLVINKYDNEFKKVI